MLVNTCRVQVSTRKAEVVLAPFNVVNTPKLPPVASYLDGTRCFCPSRMSVNSDIEHFVLCCQGRTTYRHAELQYLNIVYRDLSFICSSSLTKQEPFPPLNIEDYVKRMANVVRDSVASVDNKKDRASTVVTEWSLNSSGKFVHGPSSPGF